jgi:hypothetical protein
VLYNAAALGRCTAVVVVVVVVVVVIVVVVVACVCVSMPVMRAAVCLLYVSAVKRRRVAVLQVRPLRRHSLAACSCSCVPSAFLHVHGVAVVVFGLARASQCRSYLLIVWVRRFGVNRTRCCA